MEDRTRARNANIFYTVDRRKTLRAGQKLDCDGDLSGRKFYPVASHYSEADIETLLHELYPQGTSMHGKEYLLDRCIVMKDSAGKTLPAVSANPQTELIFELVRRLSFPHLPSRFTSMFGWEQKEEAAIFREQHCSGSGQICEVSAELGFKGDMGLLLPGGTILGSWLFAQRYWSGMQLSSPSWECLLLAPVFVMAILPD